MKNKINSMLMKVRVSVQRATNNDGAAYVQMLIKILISVVVGALLLTLIVALINALWPELTQRIMDLFRTDAGTTST